MDEISFFQAGTDSIDSLTCSYVKISFLSTEKTWYYFIDIYVIKGKYLMRCSYNCVLQSFSLLDVCVYV